MVAQVTWGSADGVNGCGEVQVVRRNVGWDAEVCLCVYGVYGGQCDVWWCGVC